jgi:hypothetical protein
LSPPKRLITGIRDGLYWKLGVINAQFLEADDIRLSFGKPLQQPIEAIANTIDVIGSNEHMVEVAVTSAEERSSDSI